MNGEVKRAQAWLIKQVKEVSQIVLERESEG